MKKVAWLLLFVCLFTAVATASAWASEESGTKPPIKILSLSTLLDR